MKVKKIINNLELVVAELELHHHAGKAVQSGLNLCAKITENGEDKIIPLNTPDWANFYEYGKRNPIKSD